MHFLDRMAQQHAEQVKVLCENIHFRRLVCRLNKKDKNSSLSMALVDASHRILDESGQLPRRYVFSQSQVAQLETEFGYNRYIGKRRLIELASELSIDERTLMRWFQRRRHKEKQQRRIAPVLPVVQHFGLLDALHAIAG